MTKYIYSYSILIIILFMIVGIKMPPNYIEQNNDFIISKKHLLGQINASKDSLFAIIKKPYTTKPNSYMHKDAYKAYKKMYASAAKDGIELRIVSAFRSFKHQKSIWEAKWTGTRKVLGQDLSKKYPKAEERAKVILMFSSMPGTSRHHWGTDIDIYSVEEEDFQSGKGKKIYEWLLAHANDFGFCQVYTPKPATRPYGYEEEKWHWSYKPIAEKYLNQYKNTINYNDISGFMGDGVAKKIQVIKFYVLGINPDCKKSIKEQ